MLVGMERGRGHLHGASPASVCVRGRAMLDCSVVVVGRSKRGVYMDRDLFAARDWMDWRPAMSYMVSHVLVVDTLPPVDCR